MKQVNSLLFALGMLLLSCNTPSDESRLQNGDLLFSVGKGESELLQAIQNSTSGREEIPFSHVGIVSMEDSSEIYVIEATSPEGVVKTPLNEFIGKTAVLDEKPLIAVGRIIPEYRYIIPEAIGNAKKHLGKKYDYAYDENNHTFYCSELVRFAFIDSTGNPVFKPLSMSFKNKETGVIDPYWTEHFQQLGLPVPEEEPGTNPADMAKSEIIEIVHTYY